ncbi:MAG: nucleotidyl transferase AbiEii/AbiGii toxin family protein [Pseudomonadota bacterium]
MKNLEIRMKPEGTSRIIEGASYEGVRVSLRGSLGTARVVIQVDIAFGDIIVPLAMTADYPTILDLPVLSVQGYSKESTIAFRCPFVWTPELPAKKSN